MAMGGDSASYERERELKRMGKGELARLTLSLETQVGKLQQRVIDVEKEAREKEQDRSIELSEAGNIAEASLRITDVFEEAQKAADTYLLNIREMEERHRIAVEQKFKAADEAAKKIVSDAGEKAKSIIAKAEEDGKNIIAEAQKEAERREKEADKYYDNIKERTKSALMNLSRFNEDYEKLKKIAGQKPEDGVLVVSGDGKLGSNVAAEDGSLDPQKLYKTVDSLIDSQRAAS